MRLLFAHGHLGWQAYAGLAFSLVFFVVGVLRYVEFMGLGLRTRTLRLLIACHVIGCLLLSGAISLAAINILHRQRTLSFILFISALVFFVPGQFTIATMRRRKLEQEAEKKQGR